MATHSTISIQNEDGTVDSIYCHWDGFLDHNGKILKEHYTTEEKVRELINLGSLSSLDENIGVKIKFDDSETKKANKQCLAYGRDRGVAECEAERGIKFAGELEDYNYLFKDGEWFYSTYGELKSV